MNKICNICGSEDFIDYTNKGKAGTRCKQCTKRYTGKWQSNNRALLSKNATNYLRKKNTGFTPEEYEQKLIDQNYSCAICGIHQSQLKRALSADHNHTTKKKRGLLCNRCNMLLGHAQDDISILSSAIEYLYDHDHDL